MSATPTVAQTPVEIKLPQESSWTHPGWRVASYCIVFSMHGRVWIDRSLQLRRLHQTADSGIRVVTPDHICGVCLCLLHGICSPGLGYLLDRFGPRRVILPALVLFALAFSSLALLQNSLPQLLCTFILIGAIGNATAQLGYTRAVSSWFVAHRGAAIATLLAGSSIGMIAAPILAQKLLTEVGWRWSYAILGALPLLIAFPLAAFFVREQERVPSQHLTTERKSLTAIRSRAFWILLVTLFLAAMSTTGTITQLSALLTDRGIKPIGAGYAVAVTGASSFVGRLITGWLLDGYFAPRVGMALSFTTAAGLYILSSAQTLSTAIVAAILIGFSIGGESDVTPYLLARYFGIRQLGLLYGWAWTAFAVAAAMGSVLLGRGFDKHGTYESLLVLFAIATFIAGALMLAMPQYPERAEL